MASSDPNTSKKWELGREGKIVTTIPPSNAPPKSANPFWGVATPSASGLSQKGESNIDPFSVTYSPEVIKSQEAGKTQIGRSQLPNKKTGIPAQPKPKELFGEQNPGGLVKLNGDPDFLMPKGNPDVWVTKAARDSMKSSVSDMRNGISDEAKSKMGLGSGANFRLPVSSTLENPNEVMIDSSRFDPTADMAFKQSLKKSGVNTLETFTGAPGTAKPFTAVFPSSTEQDQITKADLSALGTNKGSANTTAANKKTGKPPVDPSKVAISSNANPADTNFPKNSGAAAAMAGLSAAAGIPLPKLTDLKNPGGASVAAPTTASKADVVNAAKTNTPPASIKVGALPTNTGEGGMNEAAGAVGADRTLNYKDKLVKNHSPQMFELGMRTKIDVPAHIRIMTDKVATTGGSPAYDKFKKSSVGYIDCFVLKSVRHSSEEKYFVFQALNGDTTSFFFGAKPQVYSFAGVVLDSQNQQWYNDFRHFYENYIRGSKTIENKTRVFMAYTDQLIEGFILNSSFDKVGDTTDWCNFSFDMLVIQKTDLDYTDPIKRPANGSDPAAPGEGKNAKSAVENIKKDQAQSLLGPLQGFASAIGMGGDTFGGGGGLGGLLGGGGGLGAMAKGVMQMANADPKMLLGMLAGGGGGVGAVTSALKSAFTGADGGFNPATGLAVLKGLGVNTKMADQFMGSFSKIPGGMGGTAQNVLGGLAKKFISGDSSGLGMFDQLSTGAVGKLFDGLSTSTGLSALEDNGITAAAVDGKFRTSSGVSSKVTPYDATTVKSHYPGPTPKGAAPAVGAKPPLSPKAKSNINGILEQVKRYRNSKK
jgi:hypothetical protein